MLALKVEGLHKTYKKMFTSKNHVLQGIDFEIRSGGVTGFLGSNGGGKTSTLKCVLGLAFPDRGRIQFFGEHDLSPGIKQRIGFLPERPYFYDYLTGIEFLKFYGKLSQTPNLTRRIEELLEAVGLVEAGSKPLRTYSKGMLQKIGLAQAIIHNPDLVILDEPMAGLDPDGRENIKVIIKRMADEGKAVFFSSHLMVDSEQLCDDLVIIKGGQVHYCGKTSALLAKTHSGWKLNYSLQEQLKVASCQNSLELQQQIDQVRKERGSIISVIPQQHSLERVFSDLNKEN